ncbi:MAG: hypothetical protein ACTSP3_04805, partial [Candidatus Heimdallarchaeaceae archaeon]
LLKEGGVLGIITPDSYLLGRYYSKIRSYILQNAQICDISLLEFEPFSKAVLGRTLISFFRKSKKYPQTLHKAIFLAKRYSTLKEFRESSPDVLKNNQRLFYSSPRNRFFLFFSKEEKQFVENWEKKAQIKLKELVSIHTGVRSKIGQKNIIAKNRKGKAWKKGIISSSQVQPFYLDYQGHWLNIDKTKLWSGGFNKEMLFLLR